MSSTKEEQDFLFDTIGEHFDTFEEVKNKIESISAADLQEAAKIVFKEEYLSTLILKN